MENASKALMMAAGVLIGILVLSLAVYLFVNFGGTSAQVHKQVQQTEINKFNVQFTVYESMEDVTIYDVITVANLAKENNKYYELEKAEEGNLYVSVKLGNESLETKSSQYLEDKIKNENYNLPKYTCKTYINPTTGRVNKVVFVNT